MQTSVILPSGRPAVKAGGASTPAWFYGALRYVINEDDVLALADVIRSNRRGGDDDDY